jgi:hypothetical protein
MGLLVGCSHNTYNLPTGGGGGLPANEVDIGYACGDLSTTIRTGTSGDLQTGLYWARQAGDSRLYDGFDEIIKGVQTYNHNGGTSGFADVKNGAKAAISECQAQGDWSGG